VRRVIVECTRGGRYSTIWLPFGSLKAIRLGRTRIQYCPIHRRFERVRKVDPRSLSRRARRRAQALRDLPIP